MHRSEPNLLGCPGPPVLPYEKAPGAYSVLPQPHFCSVFCSSFALLDLDDKNSWIAFQASTAAVFVLCPALGIQRYQRLDIAFESSQGFSEEFNASSILSLSSTKKPLENSQLPVVFFSASNLSQTEESDELADAKADLKTNQEAAENSSTQDTTQVNQLGANFLVILGLAGCHDVSSLSEDVRVFEIESNSTIFNLKPFDDSHILLFLSDGRSYSVPFEFLSGHPETSPITSEELSTFEFLSAIDPRGFLSNGAILSSDWLMLEDVETNNSIILFSFGMDTGHVRLIAQDKAKFLNDRLSLRPPYIFDSRLQMDGPVLSVLLIKFATRCEFRSGDPNEFVSLAVCAGLGNVDLFLDITNSGNLLWRRSIRICSASSSGAVTSISQRPDVSNPSDTIFSVGCLNRQVSFYRLNLSSELALISLSPKNLRDSDDLHSISESFLGSIKAGHPVHKLQCMPTSGALVVFTSKSFSIHSSSSNP